MGARTYDVAVVGAGPAGGMAALTLARAGVDVLLLEKQHVGRDKPCGGGLTARAWSGLEIDISDLVECTASGSEVHNGQRMRVVVPLGDRPVLMVQRSRLDARIARSAAEAGADLREREPAVSLREAADAVEVGSASGTYRARTLLLATGAEGRLRRDIGLPPPAGVMAVGLELDDAATAKLLHPRRIVFDYSIPGGYAWIFPKGERYNVGVLSTRRSVTPQLRSLLGAYIERCGVRFHDGAAPARRAVGRRIPMYTRRARLATRRCALIGDAGGLADSMYGEGIAEAFASGRLAARAALAFLEGRADGLHSYARSVDETIGPHLRRLHLVSCGVYAMPAFAVSALRLPPIRAAARHYSTAPFSAS